MRLFVIFTLDVVGCDAIADISIVRQIRQIIYCQLFKFHLFKLSYMVVLLHLLVADQNLGFELFYLHTLLFFVLFR